MKKITLIILGLQFLIAYPSWAQQDPKQALAEELYVAMDLEAQMKGTMEEVMKVQEAAFANLPSDQAAMFSDATAKQMDTQKMHQDFVTVYSEILTEDELRGLIAFYKSDLGKSYAQKTPQITKRMMERNQAQMQEIQANIEERLSEANARIDQSKQSNTTP